MALVLEEAGTVLALEEAGTALVLEEAGTVPALARSLVPARNLTLVRSLALAERGQPGW